MMTASVGQRFLTAGTEYLNRPNDHNSETIYLKKKSLFNLGESCFVIFTNLLRESKGRPASLEDRVNGLL